MLQYSKLLRSREAWLAKVVARAGENRELRKAVRRYQQKIAELQANETIEASEDEKKR